MTSARENQVSGKGRLQLGIDSNLVMQYDRFQPFHPLLSIAISDRMQCRYILASVRFQTNLGLVGKKSLKKLQTFPNQIQFGLENNSVNFGGQKFQTKCSLVRKRI